MKKRNVFFIGWMTLLFASCSNHVDFGEQYKKVIYIVNSKEQIYYAVHQPVAASPGSISFYCGGSELPDEDIHIKYELDAEVLAEYNKNEFGDQTERYFLMVPNDRITYHSNDVVIKRGQEFGTLDFVINVAGLNPERIYVIPVSIADTDGYEVNPEQKCIFYVLRVQNKYAGDYTSVYTMDGVKRTLTKTGMAMTANQILLPVAGNDNTASYADGYYLIQIQEDNSLLLLPYLQLQLEQINDETTPTNYYDEENNTFYLKYKIFDQWGDPIVVTESLIGM